MIEWTYITLIYVSMHLNWMQCNPHVGKLLGCVSRSIMFSIHLPDKPSTYMQAFPKCREVCYMPWVLFRPWRTKRDVNEYTGHSFRPLFAQTTVAFRLPTGISWMLLPWSAVHHIVTSAICFAPQQWAGFGFWLQGTALMYLSQVDISPICFEAPAATCSEPFVLMLSTEIKASQVDGWVFSLIIKSPLWFLYFLLSFQSSWDDVHSVSKRYFITFLDMHFLPSFPPPRYQTWVP